MEYAIRVENLEKKFNGFTAVDGVSFGIKKGEVTGYLGPNGAGKTTTIKVLTDLIKPTSGHAYINDIDVNKNPKEALQHVGSLIEVPGVYDYLTPHEILAYFGKVHGMSNREVDQRIQEVLELTKISDWEHKKIASFSTGMQRRLMIARAILHNPEILILDEPAIGLDPKGIKDVRELIGQFQSDNMTVFLSSHLLQEVSETCGSVIFLNEGKIVAHDTVENVRRRVENKIINIKFLKPPSKEDIAKIESIESVGSIETNDDMACITFDGKPETASQILLKLAHLGFEIISYAPENASLEDFYLTIMGDERGVK